RGGRRGRLPFGPARAVDRDGRRVAQPRDAPPVGRACDGPSHLPERALALLGSPAGDAGRRPLALDVAGDLLGGALHRSTPERLARTAVGGGGAAVADGDNERRALTRHARPHALRLLL